MADKDRKRVLIICTGNSARSQMAEGLLRALAGDRFEVFSAGTFATFVRPQAITVMNELGIDISAHRSKSVNEFIDTDFDYVITVCDHANQRCPIFPGSVERIHWSIEDPVMGGSEEAKLAAFREARDELQERIRGFIEQKKAPPDTNGDAGS
jgi:arsenate reductase